MRTKVDHFLETVKQQIVQKYLSTDQSQKELKLRYNIRGKNSITKWMRKFDLKSPFQ